MRKNINIIFTVILLVFSFYYTHVVSNYIKSKDPIMNKIKENKKKFESKEIDAIINNNTIIPGKKGIKVNINASYKKMKRVKKYTESLYVFSYTNPKISINNKYDKLIINGNKSTNNISILLKINDINLLIKLKDNTSLNFILDNTFINDNVNYLKQINNNIIVLESDYLVNLDIIDYCYSTNSFKQYCSYYNKYTIKPTFITNNYYYNTYKLISNGIILSYNIINESNINDLNIILSYLKTLKYNIVSIDELIKE